MTDSGAATPPPLPDALITPTTSGITKAEENTGPRNPMDWAMTSGSDSSFGPRRSYEPESCDSELAIGFSFIFITGVGGQPLTVRLRDPEHSPRVASKDRVGLGLRQAERLDV